MKGTLFLLRRIRALEVRLAVAEEIIRSLEARPQLRRHDLARRFNVSLRTINRAMKDRRLPKQTYLFGPFWSPEQLQGLSLE